MSNLSIGYLFKKKHVTYQSKKWEIFEFVDYITAISFTNADNNEICNILSGNNAGSYAFAINGNANEEDLVFISDNLNIAIKDNKNQVNFDEIRKIRIAKGSGRSVEEVNRLLKQFEQMKTMMKQFKNGNFKMPF